MGTVEETYQDFLYQIGEEEFRRPYRIVCENIRQELEEINRSEEHTSELQSQR